MSSIKNKINAQTVKIQRSDLNHVLSILAEMDTLLHDHVQEKLNMLLMSSGYENLGSAIGILSAALPENSAGLAVSNPETRQSIKTAYAHLNAALPNTSDGSTAQTACLQLQACLFTILNMRYVENKAQAAVESVMSAASCGLDTLNGLIEAGPESLEPDYINHGGQKLTEERMILVRDVLASFMPAAPEQNTNENTSDDNDEGQTCGDDDGLTEGDSGHENTERQA